MTNQHTTNDLHVLIIGAGKQFSGMFSKSTISDQKLGITGLVLAQGLKRVGSHIHLG